jgi:hypothetical protein
MYHATEPIEKMVAPAGRALFFQEEPAPSAAEEVEAAREAVLLAALRAAAPAVRALRSADRANMVM